jgi:hypothetical protein
VKALTDAVNDAPRGLVVGLADEFVRDEGAMLRRRVDLSTKPMPLPHPRDAGGGNVEEIGSESARPRHELGAPAHQRTELSALVELDSRIDDTVLKELAAAFVGRRLHRGRAGLHRSDVQQPRTWWKQERSTGLDI